MYFLLNIRINNSLKCLVFITLQNFERKKPALRKKTDGTMVFHIAQYKLFCLELYICYTYCMYEQVTVLCRKIMRKIMCTLQYLPGSAQSSAKGLENYR
jgi:hypothetical protein